MKTKRKRYYHGMGIIHGQNIVFLTVDDYGVGIIKDNRCYICLTQLPCTHAERVRRNTFFNIYIKVLDPIILEDGEWTKMWDEEYLRRDRSLDVYTSHRTSTWEKSSMDNLPGCNRKTKSTW